MDDGVLERSEYDFVEWSGRPVLAARTMHAKPAPAFDLARISLATDHELRYWTRELGVTVYELRDAFAVTGTRCADAIRAYLDRLHAPPAER